MNVLIVESKAELAETWRAHLERDRAEVRIAATPDQAVDLISAHAFDVIVIDLILVDGGSGLAVADYAQYRRPDARVIFVTDTAVFSDGSIFSIMPNASAYLPTETEPEDIAALVEHYGLLGRKSLAPGSST